MEQTQTQAQTQSLSQSHSQQTSHKNHFTVSTDIFSHPDLDIHSQMMYIVLSSYIAESTRPGLTELAQKGRMTVKMATQAMQSLVGLKLIPHKLFRQLVNEFRDDRLSWAAKGLLTYCKEHPTAAIEHLLDMSDRSGEDETSIRKALGELKQAGYLEEFPELSRLA